MLYPLLYMNSSCCYRTNAFLIFSQRKWRNEAGRRRRNYFPRNVVVSSKKLLHDQILMIATLAQSPN